MTETAVATKTVNSEAPTPQEKQLILGNPDYANVTDQVAGIVENPMPRWWNFAFSTSFLVLLLGIFAAVYLISTGVGVWGLNQPVGWAFDITNFVFWVGIGHAGTLISAILLLFRQKWRTSINRFAEAMTIFAVMCAGIFPAIHVGRVWMIWFLAPIPNSNAIWQNFRSPLLWDVFAVSTYFLVSLLFWYVGMIPDLATLRDRAKTKVRQTIYGLLAMGWRGSARHWHNYEMAILLLAGLSTPLVLSVHTIVSFDFATSVIPGWHATLFPPYFVAGAIFSGFAMVITLMVPCRQLFRLENIVNSRHLNAMSLILLVTGLMVGYAYTVEFFTAWYSGNEYEQYAFLNRAFGPYAWAYWIMVTCNVLLPQVLWFPKMRVNPWVLFAISIGINIGMWFERFVIIVTSLHRDFLPSSWGYFIPTWVDILQLIGSFGLFFTLFFLFLRFLPMIAMFEVKSILPSQAEAKESNPINNGENLKQQTKETPPNTFGLLAEFKTPEDLSEAVVRVRGEGYKEVDAFSPFPIHGLEKKLGLGDSKLSPIAFLAGIIGLCVALGGMWYLNVMVYPIITGGKPYGAIQPLIPIIFEVTILFAAVATVVGMFILNRLPKFYHPLFENDNFSRVTNDGFFLLVGGNDPLFDPEKTKDLLTEVGGHMPTVVEEK